MNETVRKILESQLDVWRRSAVQARDDAKELRERLMEVEDRAGDYERWAAEIQQELDRA